MTIVEVKAHIMAVQEELWEAESEPLPSTVKSAERIVVAAHRLWEEEAKASATAEAADIAGPSPEGIIA